MIELPREALLTFLDNAANGGHLLVVGEPGAGKSWLLKSFVTRRKKLGEAVIFLRAEDYAVTSLNELLKSIGTDNFLAALRAFGGERKFLVIDSLDSLRAEASQRAFRELIRIVQHEVPDFTVVVSIRTFDMQQSSELQHLFPNKNGYLSSTPGILARHIVVPVFSEFELNEATEGDEKLRALVRSASPAARALLCNPFNLWLVVHLIEAGAPVDWLSAIQSEVQLLDGYWRYRIDSRDDSFARTALLTAVTDRMVKEENLSMALREIANAHFPDSTFKGLLSDEILTKSENGRLSYSHNIFFDFAISKLLIDEMNVMDFVLAAPARAIFYRPSISYFMTRLWFRDRNIFWKSAEGFFEKQTGAPSVVAITAARTIFEVAQTNEDISPLFAMPAATRSRAIVFLLRTTQALNGTNSPKRYLWMFFLLASFEYLDLVFINEYTALLETFMAAAEVTPEEVHATLAKTAVLLLRWIWKKSEEQSDLSDAQNLADFAAAHLIPLVAKHYAAIPAVAKDVLTEVLGRFNSPRSSANEAFRVVSNLDSIIDSDPDFVSEIYAAILGHEEKSEEQTRMGGAIMPLFSTRAQDFSLSHYVLGAKYPHLAARDPSAAAKTAARSITVQIKRKEGDTINTLRAYDWTFTFLDTKITLSSDRSEIWDHSHRDYTSVQLVDQLLRVLSSEMARGELSPGGVRAILCELGAANTYAVTWKRILAFASYTGEFLALIPDLLCVPELLAAPETTEAAGAAIVKAYEGNLFTEEEFAAIQGTILKLPEMPLSGIFRDPLLVRDRLLSCIPEERLTPDARATLNGRKLATVNMSSGFSQVGGAFFGPDEENGWLKRQGVETDREDNRTLLAATHSLKIFESQFVNQMPPKSQAEGIIAELWNSYQLLERTKTADERVVTDALTTLAAVAQAILKNKDFSEDSEILFKCKAIITTAADYPLPPPAEGADANFDRPAWSPTPKIEAAQGVMHYLGNWGTDQQMKHLAEQLSSDPSPAVRLQIAMGLVYLYEKNRDLFWKIANARSSVENAIGVLASLAQAVTHPYIAKRERAAVIEWQTSLLGRELASGHIDDVLKTVAHSLTDLFVLFDDANASKALEFFEKHPGKYSREISQIALSATYYLSDGIGSDDQTKDDIRSRARAIWTRALSCADLVISEYFSTPKASSPEDHEREQETLKGALTVIDSAVFQLYLLFRVDENLRHDNLPSLDDPQRKKLFSELEPIWKLLLGPIGPQHKGVLPAQTTHHLMELFRTTVSYDPPRVLQLAADLFKGFNMGYQSDQMAIGEIVQFAEVILADHKDTLKNPTNVSNLASILDQFVEVGWPQATQLVMKLDSAVR